MATNTFAPTGLVWSRNVGGAAPIVQKTATRIKKGYGSAAGTNPSGDFPCLVITDPTAAFRAHVTGGPWAAVARQWLPNGTHGNATRAYTRRNLEPLPPCPARPHGPSVPAEHDIRLSGLRGKPSSRVDDPDGGPGVAIDD